MKVRKLSQLANAYWLTTNGANKLPFAMSLSKDLLSTSLNDQPSLFLCQRNHGPELKTIICTGDARFSAC